MLIFSGSLAPMLAVLWAHLSSDVPSVVAMRKYLVWVLGLCAAFPPVLLGVNYAIVAGGAPRHLAILPAAVALAAAIGYLVVIRPLSGITGVGLGTRLLLRSSALWLVACAAMQFSWVTARVLADQPRLLWFMERPAIDLGLIGFAIPAALGVLMACLQSIYHARDMTQMVIRSHYPMNGLVVAWTLMTMWSTRFPGGYQSLVAPVVAIAILIFMSLIAASSGLLDWRRVWRDGGGNGPDGPIARKLASLVVVLLIAVGALLTIDAATRAALGGQLVDAMLCALAVAVALGIVPLTLAAALAGMRRRRNARHIGTAAAIIAGGAIIGISLRSAEGVLERSIAGLTMGVEVAVAIGVGLLVVAALRTTVRDA
jgi:hypothetical protein